MPVSGLHVGDRVMTPAGRYAIVRTVSTYRGREFVTVVQEGTGRVLRLASSTVRKFGEK